MSETEIYDRLNELSSYFSFGRVLGYIAFFETIGIESQLKHGQDANKDRMLSSELNFLAGLWIQNVVLDKTWDITLDDDFTREVYKLMDDLHSLYLQKNDLSNKFLRCSSMKEIWLMTGNMLISPEKSIICHSYIMF